MSEHDQIDCPHCGGSGKVDEDFLTEDHVGEVFADYCKVFGYHLAYGVESYDDCGATVGIKQDVSARSCYNCRYHTLPKSYFTRDQDKRLALMTVDREAEKKAQAREEIRKKAAKLADHEAAAAKLREELKP